MMAQNHHLETYRVPSQRELNCGQIFAKGPIFTKEIFDKVNKELVPKKTKCCGREIKIKKVLYVTGLILLLMFSLFGTYIAWFTKSFDNFALSLMILSSNKSENYKMWQSPSTKLLIKAHIFNYTNVKDFNDGMARKLRVKDVGPYVYEEKAEKVNVTFHNDSRVSYRLKRTFAFRPDLSIDNPNHPLVVPNIPLLVGSARFKTENYFARLAFSGVLSGFDEEPFLKLSADSYLMGYKSSFYDLARTFSQLNDIPIPEKMGLFSPKIGVSPYLFTVNTGEKDLEKIGVIEELNGEKYFDYYQSEECNKVESSEIIFPPLSVQRKEPIYVMVPEICKRMPLIFEKEVKILNGKVPAYRYTFPQDIYDYDNPSNQCYCSSSGQCPLKGTFNISSCNYGTPLVVSHPHFFNADPRIFKQIDGLEPAKNNRTAYVNLHPFMGFIMTGRSAAQINLQVQKAYGVSQVDKLNDGMLLPLIWFELGADEQDISQDIMDIIHEATFTLPYVRTAFQFVTLLTAIVTFLSLCLIFLRNSKFTEFLTRCNDDDDSDDDLEV